MRPQIMTVLRRARALSPRQAISFLEHVLNRPDLSWQEENVLLTSVEQCRALLDNDTQALEDAFGVYR